MHMLRDVKLAIRSLWRSKGFTAMAWLTLSLGIAAVGAVFPLVNAVMIKGLPFHDADRLVFLRGTLTRETPLPLPLGYLDLQAIGDQGEVFASLSPVTSLRSFNLLSNGQAEHIVGEMVGADYFTILGATTALGRVFTADEARPPHAVPVAVIAHALWRDRFGAAPGAVGQLVDLNGREVRVIGVAEPGFRGLSDRAQIWLPIGMAHGIYGPHYTDLRPFRWLSGVARLRDGVPVERAVDVVETIGARQRQSFPKDNEHVSFYAASLHQTMLGDLRTPLLAIFAAAGLVLLIACVNVANMLLARGTARAPELALRRALGANRMRLVHDLVVESAVLSTGSAAVGFALAAAVPGLLSRFAPADFLSFLDTTLDWRVVLVVVAAAFVATVAAGLAPAWFVFRADPVQLLREGSRGGGAGHARHRAQLLLLVAEVSLAVILLVTGSLMTRGFTRFLDMDLGFRAGDLATLRLDLTAEKFKDPSQYRTAVESMLRQAATVPEVEAVTVEGPGLPTGGSYGITFRRDGARADEPNVEALRHHVTPGYFTALGIPMVTGQDFDAQSRGLVVSRALAERTWPGESPIGKLLRGLGPEAPAFEVIGMVGNVRHSGITNDEAWAPDVYINVLQFPARTPAVLTVIARTRVPAERALRPLDAAMRSAFADLPPYDLKTMRQRLGTQTSQGRFAMVLMDVLAAVSLLLAVSGIYGVVSYMVTLRTREIGIRMALGSSRQDVLLMVLRRTLLPVAAGLVIGGAGLVPLSGYLRSLLYGLDPSDPGSLAAMVALVIVASVAAALVPALRATRVSPSLALRSE